MVKMYKEYIWCTSIASSFPDGMSHYSELGLSVFCIENVRERLSHMERFEIVCNERGQVSCRNIIQFLTKVTYAVIITSSGLTCSNAN